MVSGLVTSPEDHDLILLKVQADRVHAWANGEETIIERGGRVERVPSGSGHS